ncbi:AAA family ATPase [Rhodococcus koreensis]
MLLSGRPLLDNPVDAALFVDREEPLARIDAAVRRGLNVLVTGDPGLGKTTLLRQAMYRARTPQAGDRVGGYPMRFIHAQGIPDGRGLLAQIVTGEHTPTATTADLLDQLTAERSALLDDTGAGAETATAGPVLVVDDVTATAGHELFGRLRDELWETGYQWIVAARAADRGGLLTPPADAFFDTVIDLPALTAEAATALLSTRLSPDPGSLPAEIAGLVGGNPRRLIAAARDLVDLPAPQHRARLDVLALRNRRIHALGRSESMLAAELEALGGASASDAALLNRLGWTRARAVQVLTKLEEEGLVVGEDVAAGPGRPRKVYRLAFADELLLPRTEDER